MTSLMLLEVTKVPDWDVVSGKPTKFLNFHLGFTAENGLFIRDWFNHIIVYFSQTDS